MEKHDLESKEFWEEIGKIFEGTMELIQHIAEKEGIDLSKVDVEEDMKGLKEAEDRAHQHPISVMAKKYIDIKEEFYKNQKELFVQRANEIKTQQEIGINTKKIKDEVEEITDIMAIIGWYSPQIWVKMMRALTGKFDGEEWQDENGFPRDSDGSSKVALIGIDRSIGAWGRMRELFAEKTDEIISILLHLDKLRKQIEKEFPQARSFARPGFDDVSVIA